MHETTQTLNLHLHYILFSSILAFLPKRAEEREYREREREIDWNQAQK